MTVCKECCLVAQFLLPSSKGNDTCDVCEKTGFISSCDVSMEDYYMFLCKNYTKHKRGRNIYDLIGESED